MSGHGNWAPLGLKSEIQKELLEYWSDKSGHRPMPSRADLDPVDIPHLLPHIGLIDVLGGGLRFRYRLIGTNLNEVFGQDFTGTYLDQARSGDHLNYLDALYKRCIQGPRVVYSESESSYENRTHLWVARLLLPLSRDGERVNMILYSEVFMSRQLWSIDRPRKQFVTDSIIGVREIERRESGIA